MFDYSSLPYHLSFLCVSDFGHNHNKDNSELGRPG